jgi:hypothetical protein
VADRYGRGKRRSLVEVFRIERQVKKMVAGRTLRILADDHFALIYTVDDWQTVYTEQSRSMGVAGHFVDVKTEPNQAGSVIFTMHWGQSDRWEGRNFEVRLDAVHDQAAAEHETAVAHASS